MYYLKPDSPLFFAIVSLFNARILSYCQSHLRKLEGGWLQEKLILKIRNKARQRRLVS
jgi:hypothetical protein